MTIYLFKALNAKGRTIKGEMTAAEEAELTKALRKMGLQPLWIKEKKFRERFSLLSFFYYLIDMGEHCLRAVFGTRAQEKSPQTFERTRAARSHIRARIAKGDTSKMPTFFYCATTARGRRVYGEIEARDENDLRNRLLLLELTLVRAKYEQALPEGRAIVRLYRLPLKEEVILATQLEIYFRLDMVMTEILDAVRVACGSKRLKSLLLGIRNHVANGDSFVRAAKRYPHAFSRFFMGVLEVGEETGRFSGVLMYAAAHLRWVSDFWRNLKRELRWPVFSLLFTSGFFLWFPVYFVHLILFQNVTLSPEIHAPLARVVSPLLMDNGVEFLGLPLCFYLVFRLARKVDVLAIAIDRLLLMIPRIGGMIRGYDMLHFTYLFSVMWEAGLTAEQALMRARNIVHNRVLRNAVTQVADRVHHGATLSLAMAETGEFEPTVVMAFRQGETTGRFEDVLGAVYYFNTRRLEDAAFSFLWKLRLLMFFLSAVCLLSMPIVARMILH